jgi:hypothetical protein
MSTKHTQEPWEASGCTIRPKTTFGGVIAEAFPQDSPNARNDIARIVECVNAMAGINHPEEFMRFCRSVKVDDLDLEAIGKLKEKNRVMLDALLICREVLRNVTATDVVSAGDLEKVVACVQATILKAEGGVA